MSDVKRYEIEYGFMFDKSIIDGEWVKYKDFKALKLGYDVLKTCQNIDKEEIKDLKAKNKLLKEEIKSRKEYKRYYLNRIIFHLENIANHVNPMYQNEQINKTFKEVYDYKEQKIVKYNEHNT